MSMSDPIADMLTRIRNANSAYQEKVEMPASTVKAAVLNILKEEGFVKNFESVNNGKTLTVTMKYGSNKEKVISGIKRISTPGLRGYAKKEELPRVLGGLGIAVISTSQGVMSDKTARKLGLGGEVIAYVW